MVILWNNVNGSLHFPTDYWLCQKVLAYVDAVRKYLRASVSPSLFRMEYITSLSAVIYLSQIGWTVVEGRKIFTITKRMSAMR